MELKLLKYKSNIHNNNNVHAYTYIHTRIHTYTHTHNHTHTNTHIILLAYQSLKYLDAELNWGKVYDAYL